jgi:hypothetical protein
LLSFRDHVRLSRTLAPSLLCTFLAVGCAQERKPDAVERRFAALGEDPTLPEASRAVAAHTAFREWVDTFKQTPAPVPHGSSMTASRARSSGARTSPDSC